MYPSGLQMRRIQWQFNFIRNSKNPKMNKILNLIKFSFTESEAVDKFLLDHQTVAALSKKITRFSEWIHVQDRKE